MSWIKVKSAPGTGDRIVRADFIVEMNVKGPTTVELETRKGETHLAELNTLADYAKLLEKLGVD